MPFSSRDVNDVARMVALKLETYINNERREMSFDPSGRGKSSTYPTWQYDGVNRFASRDKSARRSRFRWKQYALDRPSSCIDAGEVIRPVIIDDTLRTVTRSESVSLVKCANQVFKAHPIDKLQQVLAYKPRPENCGGPETPQNYTQHVGSCLRSRDYEDYYNTHGLWNGRQRQKGKPIDKQTSSSQKPTSQTSTSKKSTSQKSTSQKSTSQKSSSQKSTSQKSSSQKSSSQTSTSQTSTSRRSRYNGANISKDKNVSSVTDNSQSGERRYRSNPRSLMRVLLDEDKPTDTGKTPDGDKTSQISASGAVHGSKTLPRNVHHPTPTDINQDRTAKAATDNNNNDNNASEPDVARRKDSKIDSAFFESLYKV